MPLYSHFPEIEISNTDIPTFIFNYARKNSIYGENENLDALIDETTTLSFADLERTANAFASGLYNNLGLRRGDVLTVVLPNTSYYLSITLGTQMIGGVCATANPAYTARELTHQLKLASTRAVITTQANLPVVKEALRLADIALPSANILTLDGTNSMHSMLSSKSFPRVFLKTEEEAATTPAFVVFSSGTSGQPKGVLLSHRNVVANVLQNNSFDSHDPVIVEADKKIRHQKWMAVLPMFHIYGLTVITHAALTKGAALVILPSFDLEKFCMLAEKHRASVAHLGPPIILRLAKDPIVNKYDLTSFVYVNSGSAPLSKELQIEAENRINASVLQGYGLSETSPTTHRTLMRNKVFGAIGSLLANIEAKFVDDNGNELPAGTVGELCVKGPNIMIGYLNNPAATREAIDRDGFLHTGDIGYLDKSGNYYITDRKKELIKYKGFQVAPAELEGLLTEHPAVIDSAVISVYDETRASEIPKGFIVVRPEMSSPGIADEVRVWLDSRVVSYKRLRGGIEVVGEIPKSVSGKILRRVLKEREAKKRTLKPKL